jgi:hypothetical protein
LWLKGVFLASLLLFILIHPLAGRTFLGQVVFDILFLWVLVSGLWNVSRSRTLLIIGFLLATPAFLASWSLYFISSPVLALSLHIFAGLFLAFVGASTIAVILQEESVSTETIFNAVSVYLLLGLVWALAYVAIEFVHPGSLLLLGEPIGQSAAPSQSLSFPLLVYYSLITLTTAGYGDIVPDASLARGVSALEAITGQLYLAILIARLVGVHASQRVHRP